MRIIILIIFCVCRNVIRLCLRYVNTLSVKKIIVLKINENYYFNNLQKFITNNSKYNNNNINYNF